MKMSLLLEGTGKTLRDLEGVLKDIWKPFIVLVHPFGKPILDFSDCTNGDERKNKEAQFRKKIENDHSLYAGVMSGLDLMAQNYCVTHPSKSLIYRPMLNCKEVYAAAESLSEFVGSMVPGDRKKALRYGRLFLLQSIENVFATYNVVVRKEDGIHWTKHKDQQFDHVFKDPHATPSVAYLGDVLDILGMDED